MTDKKNLDSLLRKTIPVALEAGREIMKIYETEDFGVETKSDDSPLTKADKAAHEIIKKGLHELTPEIPLLSEEGKDIPYEVRKQWKKFWLVDPLDGTKEFIKRNGEFTVNIALIEENEPVLGVIFAPALNKLYYGSKGNGSYKIEIGSDYEIVQRTKLVGDRSDSDNLTAVGSRSHSSPEEQEILKKYNVTEIISIGSSLKFCMVAEGKADLYYRHGPTMEWDVAAGCAIVRELNPVDFVSGVCEKLSFNKRNLLNSSFFFGIIDDTNGETAK